MGWQTNDLYDQKILLFRQSALIFIDQVHIMAIPKLLLQEIRKNYRLDWHGIHGVAHWAKVRNIGLRLSKQTGANPKIVELFAFLHDSQRLDDGLDPEHGLRASHFAKKLLGKAYDLSSSEFELLKHACERHTHGDAFADITVMTCWDADRLDLGRVGIIPDPARLCTEAARNLAMSNWAYQQNITRTFFEP